LTKNKKEYFFQNRTGEVVENKGSGLKNEPENEAEKLLKTRICGKNEPENKPGHVVENKRPLKNAPGTNRSGLKGQTRKDLACFAAWNCLGLLRTFEAPAADRINSRGVPHLAQLI